MDGFFGAAIAAGKLLKLDDEKMLNAFGIAYSQVCGGRQTNTDGAQRKHLYGGLSAKGGVIAALLAQKGVSGARNSLEGKHGLYNIYHRGDYNRSALTSDLGKRFEGQNLSCKPYPCCRTAHSYIDAALEIMRDGKLRADDITEIVVSVSDFSQGLCDPLEVKQNPPTTVQAQYSIPYTVATAVVRGAIVTEDFSLDKISDPAVLQISRKVRPRLDRQLNRRGLNPAVVEIRTKAGETFSRRVDYPSGHPSKPITDEQMVRKFKDCLGYSVRPIRKGNIQKVITMTNSLEDIEDVSKIIQLLA